MKTIQHFTNFYIWAAQSFESANSSLVQLFDAIMTVFDKFHSDTLKQVRNMPLYVDYLEALKHLLNFLNFTLKRMPRPQQDYFVEKFPRIFGIKVLLLKNMPLGGTHGTRKELLQQIKQDLQDIANFERNDRAALAQNPSLRLPRLEHYAAKDQYFKTIIEDMLITTNLSGKGKINKELVMMSK